MWKILWWMALQLVPSCGRCKEAGHRTGSKLPIIRLPCNGRAARDKNVQWLVHTKKETNLQELKCVVHETWHAVFRVSGNINRFSPGAGLIKLNRIDTGCQFRKRT